jgi:hypothetical protein
MKYGLQTKFTLTNMAVVQNLYITSDKFNIESVHN